MKDMKQIAEDAMHLTVAERVTLAESLLLTVTDSEDVLVDPKLFDEAEPRLAELKSLRAGGHASEPRTGLLAG